MISLEQWNARVAVANACLAQFEGREHEYGKADCLRLAASCLKRMGHQVPLSKIGFYKTEIGALRALKRMGFTNMIEAMDAQGFPRIAPSKAWPADIVAIAAPDPWKGALTVKLAGAGVVGSIQGEPFAALEVKQAVAAWRID